METYPYPQPSSNPADCNQFDLPPPSNRDDADDADDLCIDAMLYDEELFMGLEELIKDSPQQDALVADIEANSLPQQHELSLTDLLLTCAESVDSGNLPLASDLIARLERILSNKDNEPSPFRRLAYLFTEGLRSRAIGPRPVSDPQQAQLSTSDDMSAYQMVQELSPFMKFLHFTANQAILEATYGDPDVHVIDFDVMDGVQWPSLMVDLANRKCASLRITALVTDDNADSVHRTGRRLVEFAGTIGLSLRFDQVESKDLEGLQVGKGSVVANCMMQQSQTPGKSSAWAIDFLANVRRFSPKMVVLVEEELFRSTKNKSMTFVEYFFRALHHFASLSDSLACSFYGGYKVGLRVVEKEMLGPKIMDYLAHFPVGPFAMRGFRQSPVSSFNVQQAKHLMGLFNRGFSVEHERGRLALCWKSSPLVGVSIWVPT